VGHFLNVVPGPFSSVSYIRLYAVAEENRENIECPDQEQARTYKRHYRLGDAVLARVHLDVYLTDGHDDVNSGDSATDILDIEHHRHHEVVHRGQRVRSPAIVHAAAFGKSRRGTGGTAHIESF
jgi:hypothetical protein